MPDSYSQFGEDLIVAGLLPPRGRYLDIGAWHPTRHSNTYRLYTQGWWGVAVDLLPDWRSEWQAIRPHDMHLAPLALVANLHAGEKIAAWRVDDSALSTLNADIARERGSEGRMVESISSYAYTVGDLSELIPEFVPHFVSIDVEGSEADVLRGCPWEDGWRPKVLCIEATHPQTARPTFAAWEPLLLGLGYRLSGQTKINRIYAYRE